MTEAEKRRRSALLATLSFDQIATVRSMRDGLERVHGIAASSDLIRSDMTWLQEVGLIRFDGDAAQCTERGVDVARGRAKFPGDV